MDLPPSTPEDLARIESLIEAWSREQLAENPSVDSVERDETERLWRIRLLGEEKDVFTVWFRLGQRSLDVETFLMPAPEENHGELYEHLLRRNASLGEFRISLGEEGAVFLMARSQNANVAEEQLDRLLGAAYMYTEQFFRPAMRIGYASKFK